MKDERLLLALGLILLLSQTVPGKFLQVETEQVPVERLISNLEKQLKAKPTELQLQYGLARVNAMAYALSSGSMAVEQRTGKPWFGYGDRGEPPRSVNQPKD